MKEIEINNITYEFDDDATPQQIEGYLNSKYGEGALDCSALYTDTAIKQAEPVFANELSGSAKLLLHGFTGQFQKEGQDIVKGLVSGPIGFTRSFLSCVKSDIDILDQYEPPIERISRLGVWLEDVPLGEKIKRTLPVFDPTRRDPGAALVGKYTNLDEILSDTTGWAEKAADDILQSKLFEYENKLLFDIGSAFSSIATAAGLFYLTKNPAIVGTVFAMVTKGQVYNDAKESGKFDDIEAHSLGNLTGVLVGIAEAWGDNLIFSKLRGSTPLWRGIKAGMVEGITEAVQETIQDSLSSITGAADKTIGQIANNAIYAGILGFLTGGTFGTFQAHMDKRNVKKELAELGVKDKDAANAIYSMLYNKGKTTIGSEVKKAMNTVYNTITGEKKVEIPIEQEIMGIEEKPEEIIEEKIIEAEEPGVEDTIDIFRKSGVFGELTETLQQLADITQKINEFTSQNKPVPESLNKRKQSILDTITAISPKSKPLKNIKRIIQESIKPSAPDVVMNEAQLLRLIIKRESRAAKEAYREAEQLTKKYLIEKFKAKDADIAQLKKDAIAYTKMFLPRAIRGDVLSKINNIKTKPNLDKLFDYISEKAETYNKKTAVKKYKQLIGRVQDSKTISPAFREAILQIDSNLTTGKPMSESRIEAIKNIIAESKEEGIFSGIPIAVINEISKKNINTLSSEQIEQINNVIKHYAKLGRLKNKLSKLAEKRDLIQIAEEAQIVLKENGFNIEERPEEGKTLRDKLINKINMFIAPLRKLEFLFDEFDGFTGVDGFFYKMLYKSCYEAQNKVFVLKERDMAKINELLDKYVNSQKFYDEFEINGKKWTRQQLLGAYANSLNEDNKARLMQGFNLTEKGLSTLLKKVSSEDMNFVDAVMEIIQDKAPLIRPVLTELNGETFVERPDYFPIVYKGELEKYTEKDIDYAYMFNQLYVSRSMTRKLTGIKGKELNLEFMHVVMNHLDKANQFITHSIVAQDIRRIMRNPEIKSAIINAKGEMMYKSMLDIYSTIFHPKGIAYSSYTNKFHHELFENLRRKFTEAALTFNPIVSTLQAGSYFNAIPSVGLGQLLRGTDRYLSDVSKIKPVIERLSVQQKNRAVSLDREIRDFINSQEFKRIFKGKPYTQAMAFQWIHAVDSITSNSVWWSAFEKKMSETKGNQDAAVEYADSIVRKTQPMMLQKDMVSMMQKGGLMRVFVWFYSHWSTTGNLWTNAFYKAFSNRPAKERLLEAFGVFIWTLIIPGLYSGAIRSGFSLNPEKALKSIAQYAVSPIPFIREATAAYLYGFEPSNPVYQPFVIFADIAKDIGKLPEKGPAKLIADSIRALGMWKGKIPAFAMARAVEGAIGLLTGKADDLRQIFVSEWALK